MERGFLDSEGRKSNHRIKTDTLTSIGLASESVENLIDTSEPDGTLNEVTLASAIMESVSPSVVDMDVEKEKLSSLEDTIVLKSFSPLPTQVTTLAGNAPGKSSYANVTGKPSGKKLNIRTLFTLM
ncbi:hypothetical protein Tco_1447493, partial [Tanacetum coccineum]